MWITTNWKILKEMGIPDHLTCLLRNLYADQEATVRTGHGTMDWFLIGKGVLLFNLYAEYIMRLRSWHPVPSLHGKLMGKPWKQRLTLFFWAPKSLQMVIEAMKLKDTYSLEGKL